MFWLLAAFFRPVAVLAVLVLVLGCGVKTAPYPASATLPGPVRDLQQTLTADGELILSWYPPEENMVGRPLNSLGGFQIQMADNILDEDYCPTCPHRFVPVDLLPADPPPPGQDLASGPYFWRWPVQPGHVYHARVAAVGANGGLHPDAYIEATVWALPAPGSVDGFHLTLGEQTVILRWTPPPADFRLQLERRQAQGPWESLPDAETASGRYVDARVVYGEIYAYRARLLRARGESLRPGSWSAEQRLLVEDRSPPAAPGYLDAALSPQGIRLFWENKAEDMDPAGYRLYRRRAGEEAFRRIGPDLLPANTYLDEEAGSFQPGERVFYRVTSVDGSPLANESGPSPAAEVVYQAPSLDSDSW